MKLEILRELPEHDTQTSLTTDANPHDGDPGGLSTESVQPAGLQAEPWEQTTSLGGPGRGWEERVARGIGGGDRSKQGEKARRQHKSCGLGATDGWSHNGSVFPGGGF